MFFFFSQSVCLLKYRYATLWLRNILFLFSGEEFGKHENILNFCPKVEKKSDEKMNGVECDNPGFAKEKV